MKREQIMELIEKAADQLPYSYVPYSGFRVGAALLAKNGTIYTGCNIENAAYTPTNCAERTAFFKAVSQGKKEFRAIAVVGGSRELGQGEISPDMAYPCGICRQVMREFCGPDFRILVGRSAEDFQEYTLEELLPESFGPAWKRQGV